MNINEIQYKRICYNLGMIRSFWTELPKPFTVLAPMDGVTDFVFRQIITKIGKPDVLFTEFTSVEGLQSAGRGPLEASLKFSANEHPIVAQIWGINPENFYKSAKLIKKMGFTGIDINMGCPDRAVLKMGSCGKLIKNMKLAGEIIRAVKSGADGLPVSVKTRIGFEKEAVSEWLGFLLEQDIAALSLHLRTVAEKSKVPAHWELMPEITGLRDVLAPRTVIIGNGDILSRQEIDEKYNKYKCDGFMVGRGIFANPWIFNRAYKDNSVGVNERIDTYLEQIDLFEKTWGTDKNFANLKKFCKIYINNFPDARKYREVIMEARSIQELKRSVIECRKAQGSFDQNPAF